MLYSLFLDNAVAVVRIHSQWNWLVNPHFSQRIGWLEPSILSDILDQSTPDSQCSCWVVVGCNHYQWDSQCTAPQWNGVVAWDCSYWDWLHLFLVEELCGGHLFPLSPRSGCKVDVQNNWKGLPAVLRQGFLVTDQSCSEQKKAIWISNAFQFQNQKADLVVQRGSNLLEHWLAEIDF